MTTAHVHISPLQSPMAIREERILAQQLKQRDPEALARIYDTYSLTIYRLVFRILGDRSTAEDIVQNTFVRVWSRTEHISEETPHLGPWILTIARNLALDYARVQKSRGSSESPAADTPLDDQSAEESVITEQNARLLARALETLGSRQKQVIELAYFAGLTQVQIAERLHQPLGTVKSWTRAALMQLRSTLEPKVRSPRPFAVAATRTPRAKRSTYWCNPRTFCRQRAS